MFDEADDALRPLPAPARFLRRFTLPGAGAAAAAFGLAALAIAAPRPAVSDGANPTVTPEQAAFFESKIRPLLLESCISCHGKDAEMGGLRLDSRAALLKGGNGGPAVKPCDPEHSLLITAVHQTGALKMPQGGKLKPDQIAVLEEWVKMGAPWPEGAAAVATASKPEAWRTFWSLQPVRTAPALPKVKNKAWIRNPVDAFVLAKLETKGLTPAAPADRRTLLRRITFDLTGLPPTTAEVEAYLTDKSPDAYEKVVERLLASPRYGEYQARHWLDVARYADTKGYVFTEDRAYPNAYTYRDWVIRAFNEDLPYDRFVTYQLAADLAPEVKNGEDKRPLAALGFLTVGRRFLNSQPDIIDDRIDVTMRGFQGLTVACARCHDHKFDPIPTADYYSLYGVFDNATEVSPPISPRAISEPWEKHNQARHDAETGRDDLIRAEVKRLREQEKKDTASLAEPVKKTLQGFREHELPNGDQLKALEPVFSDEGRTRLAALRATLDQLSKNVPPTPELAMAMVDKPQPGQNVIFKRGNPGNRGDVVPRRFPLCVSPANKPRPVWTNGSGRLDLARAIASKENPLTARVFVNRVWLYHFGQGLVRTPSDFGRQGEKPTHPELLDWLAARFMADNWSIKKLHRVILLSSTYRQASDASPKALHLDPENRLVSHQNRRRLDLEQMRDALLYASGKLDTSKVGGKSEDLWKKPFTARRAVYGYVERQNLPGTFRTFDFASPDTTNPQRFRTTVPQQALFLMNSPFAAEQATALASLPEVSKSEGDPARRVRRLYLRLFGRLPDADEVQAAFAYLNAPDTSGGRPAPANEDRTWSYGWGGYDEAAKRVASFTPFARYDEGAKRWQFGSEYPAPDAPGYAALKADGGHTGRDAGHAVIRRWTAPFDATVTVKGLLRHPSEQGDGVRARLVSSRLGLLGEWTAQHGEAKTEVENVAVRKGDTLDFIVDCRATDAFDSFGWAPTVWEYKGNAVTLWNAQHAFGGRKAAPPAPLTRWERYAQALLMTNEFLFVD
jgi:cytochrome c553